MATEAELTARGDTDIGDGLVRVEQLRERARGLAAMLSRAPPVDGARPRPAARRRRGRQPRGRRRPAAARSWRWSTPSSTRLAPEVERSRPTRTAFAAQRERGSAALFDDRVRRQAASAAAEVRGELRSMRTGRRAQRERAAPQRRTRATRCASAVGDARRRDRRGCAPTAATPRRRGAAGRRGRGGRAPPSQRRGAPER